MVKAKRRHPIAISKNEDNTRAESDFFYEDSWVIVKKQRITILVPPLLAPIRSASENQRKKQVNSKGTVKSKPVVPTETHTQNCPMDEKKSLSLVQKVNIQMNRGTLSTKLNPIKEKLPKCTIRTVSECPYQCAGETMQQPSSSDLICDKKVQSARRSSKTVGLSRAPKSVVDPCLPLQICPTRSTFSHGSVSCLYGGVLQNHRMRALSLERKLAIAGGLSRWLVSLGLGQFIQIFQSRNIDKFQLVNLTMNKLKDMGANAVGPRRKLLHAIDCLYQPHPLKTF
ncbi:PREDICTED: uncharacterized protein LOC104601481 [Nelumbo nucifera]|uniref:Uncharacterized protein LOC104601481 n=2 Tax=Nelumbo nucifera TaxID=4432 RepID=A0A1U8ALA6_NELNU|nr:PREDICTED: uncharacterized protein LOC104601481 [Nelumbo nucifera]DAD29055.1 TPA_asm: hypothetical protein HUJ06_030523 [Nelumbo nucifera]